MSVTDSKLDGRTSGIRIDDLPPPPRGKAGWPWTEGSASPVMDLPDGLRWPRVSIVTPSYNQAEFLEETIRSVLLQGYPELEYIVIDGGSRDGSVDVIRKYEPWLAHWVSEPDQGQSDAINKGWARSTGEILAWLNSDDAYRPGVVEAAARRLMRDGRIGLVYGRAAVCDRESRLTGRVYGREFVVDEFTVGKCPVPQPSAFFRKSALEMAGPLDPSLHYAMDADLWLRLSSVAEVAFVDQIWSSFRIYAESKTGHGRLRFEMDTLELIQRSFARSILPRHLVQRQGSITARLLARVAMAHYRDEDDRGSRTFAVRALMRHPRIMGDPLVRADLFRCLLGRRLVRLLKGMKPVAVDA